MVIHGSHLKEGHVSTQPTWAVCLCALLALVSLLVPARQADSSAKRPVPPPVQTELDPALAAALIRAEPMPVAAEPPAPPEALAPDAEAPRLGASPLVFPVEGGPRKPIKNSFRDPRSGGRIHKAIDVSAPRGTKLFAAVDGFVKKKHRNRLGGITLYLVTEDGSHTLMYAHLSRYAEGIQEGQAVKRGDLVGYVGDTGNAKGHPHLHLAFYEVTDPARWWDGKPVNPFPLLAPLVDPELVLHRD